MDASRTSGNGRRRPQSASSYCLGSISAPRRLQTATLEKSARHHKDIARDGTFGSGSIVSHDGTWGLRHWGVPRGMEETMALPDIDPDKDMEVTTTDGVVRNHAHRE